MTDLHGAGFSSIDPSEYASGAPFVTEREEPVQEDQLIAQGPKRSSTAPTGDTNTGPKSPGTRQNPNRPSKAAPAAAENTGPKSPGTRKNPNPPNPPTVGPSREKLEQGVQQFKQNVNQTYQDRAPEPVRAVVGGLTSAAEEGAEFIKKVDDTIKSTRQAGAEMLPEPVQELFPSLTSPLNPKDNIFSNKYEAAQYDFGHSVLGARTGVGKVAEALLGFGTLLYATGGMAGGGAIGGAVKALKSGQGVVGAAKAVGGSGALRGMFADMIYRPEEGNLSNMFREYAPEFGPAWFQSLTASLAIKDDDLPWVKMFKQALEGAGMEEAAHAGIAIFKGIRHGMRTAGGSLLPSDDVVNAALDRAFKELENLNTTKPRPKTWGEVAIKADNAPYFTLPSGMEHGGFEMPPAELKRAAERLWEGKIEGFSINPTTGKEPRSGYMVAIDASTPLEAPTDRALMRWIWDNEEAMMRPDAYIGGWLDDSGRPVVEISRNVESMQEAVRLGKEFDQVSIYEVATGNFIETGGIDALKASRNIGFSDVNARVVLNNSPEKVGGRVFPEGDASIIADGFDAKSSRFTAKLNELISTNDGIVAEIKRIAPPAGGFAKDPNIPKHIAADQQFKLHTGYMSPLQVNSGRINAKAWNLEGPIDPREITGLFTAEKDVINVFGGLEKSPGEMLGTAYHESFHRLQQYYLRAEDYDILQTTFGAFKAKLGSLTGDEAISLHELQAEAFRNYALARKAGLNPGAELLGKALRTMGVDAKTIKGAKAVAPVFDFLYDIAEKAFNFYNGRGWRSIKDLFEDAYTGAVAKKGPTSTDEDIARLIQFEFNRDTHLRAFRPGVNPEIGSITDAAVQQQIGDTFDFMQIGAKGGNDPVLTRAAHKLIAASDNADEILTSIAKHDLDLSEVATRTGRTVADIREGAAALLRDFNGDVESLPKFIDAAGNPVLTAESMVVVKTLLADTANQLSAGAYSLLKTIESGADALPQMQPLVDQLKTLLRAHKFTTYHYGHGLKRLDIPGLHVNVENPFDSAGVDSILQGIRESDEFLDELAAGLASQNPEAVKKALALANSLVMAQGDPSLMKTIAYWASEVGTDTFLHVFYNSMLSGPATHVVNTLFNSVNTVYRPLTAAVGSLWNKEGQLVREEVAASFAGFHQTMGESLIAAWKAFKTNSPMNDGGKGIIHATKLQTELKLLDRVARQTDDVSLKFGVNFLKAYHALFANPVFTYGTRLLQTSDEGFKAGVSRMEWHRRSWQEAALAARNSDEPVKEIYERLLKKHAKEWFVLEGPNKGAIRDSELLRVAKEITMQQDLEGAAKKFGDLVQAMPALRIFFPFIKTGHNLNVMVATHIPGLAPLLKEYKDVMARGDAYEIAAMQGRQAFGGMLVGFAAMKAWQGGLTGGGPADPAERKVWLQNNARRAIHLGGDSWLPYQRMEPFNIILGIVADTVYHWKSGRLSDADASELMGIASFIVSSNITERSIYAGVSPLGRILSPGDQSVHALARVGGETLNNMFPLASLRRSIANSMQPYEQIYNDELQRLLWRAAGINTGMAPKHDWLTGEPVEAVGGGLGAVWPYKVVERTKDPVRDELEDIHFSMHEVLQRRNVELTPQQQSDLQKWLGTESGIYKDLEKLFKSRPYLKMKEQWEVQKAEGLNVKKQERAYYKEVSDLAAKAIDRGIRVLYWEDEKFREEADRVRGDLHKARMLDSPADTPADLTSLYEIMELQRN
jgi:hypothetical protein